ncbi:MAG: cysteine desulfurase family protein [Bacteroidota bacterium]
MRVYFDNAATTPLDARVLDKMLPYFQNIQGNASSIHMEGRTARAAIEQARKTIASLLNCSIGEIFFTSGGTESNNMILKRSVQDLGVQRIISTRIEHHCVLHTIERLEKEEKIEVEWLPVDDKGHINSEHLAKALKRGKAKTLVSLMYANNEIGTLLDFEQVAQRCADHGALFHSDTVQAIGYYDIDLDQIPVSFLTGSAHKFHGPKGTGFAYINGDNIIQPYIDGGSQERNMRAGTENTAGIVGLAEAMQLAYAEKAERLEAIRIVRDHLKKELSANFDDIEFNGDIDGQSHPKVLSVSFPPTSATDLMVFSLDIAGFAVSGGSACSSGVESGSHVMATLRGDDPKKTVRFSFSHDNTIEQVDQLIEQMRTILI